MTATTCPCPAWTGPAPPSTALSDAEWMKDEIDLVVEGKLYDFSRFLSWVALRQHPRVAALRPLLHDPALRLLLPEPAAPQRLPGAGGQRSLAVSTCPSWRAGTTRGFVLLSTTLLFDAADHDTIPLAVPDPPRLPRRPHRAGRLDAGELREEHAPGSVPCHLRSYGADAYVVTPRGEQPLLELLPPSARWPSWPRTRRRAPTSCTGPRRPAAALHGQSRRSGSTRPTSAGASSRRPITSTTPSTRAPRAAARSVAPSASTR